MGHYGEHAPPPGAYACIHQFDNFQFSSLIYLCKKLCDYCLISWTCTPCPSPCLLKMLVTPLLEVITIRFNSKIHLFRFTCSSNNVVPMLLSCLRPTRLMPGCNAANWHYYAVLISQHGKGYIDCCWQQLRGRHHTWWSIFKKTDF